MLCLPVFIILLLLASPAAPNPFERRIQSDSIRAALEDADFNPDERSFNSIIKALEELIRAKFPVIVDMLPGDKK
uniref:G110 VD Superfamily T precursor conopeptide n=1 Tax=Conus geographus TaxID=6491 RepID=X5IG44_CONGE|nr:G110_VD_Superfamily_T_precursor_conopeptide [Conus geographus]